MSDKDDARAVMLSQEKYALDRLGPVPDDKDGLMACTVYPLTRGQIEAVATNPLPQLEPGEVLYPWWIKAMWCRGNIGDCWTRTGPREIHKEEPPFPYARVAPDPEEDE